MRDKSSFVYLDVHIAMERVREVDRARHSA